MSEDLEADGEIEFLEEDADIVQQCVYNNEDSQSYLDSSQLMVVEPDDTIQEESPRNTLLVERVSNDRRRRRRRKDEEDSDYNPHDDMPPKKKKRQGRPRRVEVPVRKIDATDRVHVTTKTTVRRYEKNRKKMDIRIPDYEDPLCLPVRALLKEEGNVQKLKNWNNLCLEHFRNYDLPLRADKEETVASKRTVVLRNLYNNMTGKTETTMHSKMCVENSKGVKRSEIVQAVLPKYREKKVLNLYRLLESKKRRSHSYKEEVILTKESNKDVESLVVYKRTENLSLVYKMFERKGDTPEEDDRKYLKEVTCCKICAPCYQTSWRGFNNNDKKNITCQICKRPCISVYNLLSHMKCHSDVDIRRYKRSISRSLADAVEYHYKCRICQEQFLSIRDLRIHVNKHKGTETFMCEVGNHLTN
ncbi:myoneurin-like [Danaus plexippus]|uniref:myoneurin-like n=1 Tax=Danaus plexippus TaxID=13037 RepID=UPI002AB08E0F|nr:myoneurin-like [Danaus plexippus]